MAKFTSEISLQNQLLTNKQTTMKGIIIMLSAIALIVATAAASEIYTQQSRIQAIYSVR